MRAGQPVAPCDLTWHPIGTQACGGVRHWAYWLTQGYAGAVVLPFCY